MTELKKIQAPLAESLLRFTSCGKARQKDLVTKMLATAKPTNEPRVNPFDNPFFDYEIVLIFTGAGFIIRVKRRRKKGVIPSKKTFAEFKNDVEQFMANDYKAAASSLTKVKGMKTIELTSTADADDRILLLIPTGK